MGAWHKEGENLTNPKRQYFDPGSTVMIGVEFPASIFGTIWELAPPKSQTFCKTHPPQVRFLPERCFICKKNKKKLCMCVCV